MLKLRIGAADVAGPWVWIGHRWEAGASWIEPYRHPALEILGPDGDSPAMVVRERCPGRDGQPHESGWPGDYLTIQPAAGMLWLTAGAGGVAPLYVIERGGVLHGSWDVARPHLGDAARDRRAVYPEPRGHHVMGQPMSQVHQRGQQAVGEPEPMLCASADAAATCSRREPIPVTSLPLRCQFSDQARNRFPGQACHPTVHHDRSTIHDRNNDHRCSRTRNYARGR